MNKRCFVTMPSHRFKSHRKGGGIYCNATDLCAVKKLRRLACTLANVVDLAELLQKHAILVHCSTVRDAKGAATFGPTTPLSAKQVLEAILRLQPGRFPEGVTPPCAQASDPVASLFLLQAPPRAGAGAAQPVLRWKHPELFPGTTKLPVAPGGKQCRAVPLIRQPIDNAAVRFVHQHQTTGYDLHYIKQSTEAKMQVIQQPSELGESNSHNTPGGDLKTIQLYSKEDKRQIQTQQQSGENTENLQSFTKINISQASQQSLQNITAIDQLHSFAKEQNWQNHLPCRHQEKSTVPETAHIQHFPTDAQNIKERTSLETGRVKQVPSWTRAASQIRFKPLPDTKHRPAERQEDDYVLVLRLLEKSSQYDPALLKPIGVEQIESPSTNPRRFHQSLANTARAAKPPLTTTFLHRAQKPNAESRRNSHASSAQRRSKPRATKLSVDKKFSGGGVGPSAYGKQCVFRQSRSKTQNVQKRQSVTSQRTQKSSTIIPQQRAATDAKRFSQNATTTNPKRLAAGPHARFASHAPFISSTQITQSTQTKPAAASDMHRVLQDSTTKTQNALKRAASDFQRLSRTSTPSTNSLLKRVASDLKRISRTSVASKHILQQGASENSIAKPLPIPAAKIELPITSKFRKPSREHIQLAHCPSYEIKCHMPVHTISTDHVAKNATTEVRSRLPPPVTSSNDGEKSATINPWPTMHLEQAKAGLVQHNAGTDPWDGLRPPDCINNLAQPNANSNPSSELQSPTAGTITLPQTAISDLWKALGHENTNSVSAFSIPKPPCSSELKASSNEYIQQTNVCNSLHPPKSEGKVCVVYVGSLPTPENRGVEQDIQSFPVVDTSLVPTPQETNKVLSSDLSISSQGSFTVRETLSSRERSSSSSFESSSHTDVSIDRSDVDMEKKTSRNVEIPEQSKLSASSNKKRHFFGKIQNVFKNRFFRCKKSKLLCIRTDACGCGSATSLN